jgi:hypothetical protein
MTPRDNEPVREVRHYRLPGMPAIQAITERGQSTVDHALGSDIGTDLIASVSARTAPNGEIYSAAHVAGTAN